MNLRNSSHSRECPCPLWNACDASPTPARIPAPTSCLLSLARLLGTGSPAWGKEVVITTVPSTLTPQMCWGFSIPLLGGQNLWAP